MKNYLRCKSMWQEGKQNWKTNMIFKKQINIFNQKGMIRKICTFMNR